MSYVDFTTPAIEQAKVATQFDDQKDYERAHKEYVKAIERFMVAIKHERVAQKKAMLKSKADELLCRAEKIKEFLDNGGDGTDESPRSNNQSTGMKTKPKADQKKDEDDKEKDKMRSNLEGAIVKERPNVHWDDVAGLEAAKEALKEAVVLPIKYPQLFTGNRKPWRGILLYGPPGTGKTQLAKAVATETDGTFFSISSADLMSKWLGESEKLVRNLFEMAREHSPAIIFIDEVDSMCSARGDSESEAARRIKTEFLVQMQGVGGGSSQVLVLAATNFPWGLDAAIRRRFERRIYIPLPEAAARSVMFKIHLGDTPNDLTQQDFEMLGQNTPGYSGSDINIVVRNALMEPVRSIQCAQHFRQISGVLPNDPDKQMRNDLWCPCAPSVQGAVEMTLKDVDPDKLIPPPVSKSDFFKALQITRPSVSEADIAQHRQFTADYGQEA